MPFDGYLESSVAWQRSIAQIRRGENVLGVTLGNGWYNPLPLKMWGRVNIRNALAVGRPRLIARLEVRLADGTQRTIVSDASWKVGAGACLVVEYYNWNHYGGGTSGTFEAILFDNGSDVYGPVSESHNLREDPLFLNPFSDFHLRSGSPAIDAGDPVPPGGLGPWDFEGSTGSTGPRK